MKDIALFVLAFILAVQILLLGLLALAFNNAVLGFLCGVAIPESIHQLRRMRNADRTC